MNNEKIRAELRRVNKPQWWLADLEGCAAETMCKRLRHELPKEEQNRIIALIKAESAKR